MSINELEFEQKDWALLMLCRFGVLFLCRHYEGVYVDEGIDIELAYKYFMKVYKFNEDKFLFCNVREMTDTVQNYYYEYGGNDTCFFCTKHIDD